MLFSIRDLSRILASTALSNGFLIILSLMLARYLPSSEYAAFAYSVAVFGVASLLLDFGLNIAAIRVNALHSKLDVPTIFASMKLCLSVLIASICVVGFWQISQDSTLFSLSIGLLCAAFNNVWLAIRVSNQAEGDASGFFNANLMLSVVRVGSIGAVWVMSLPAFHYLLALYVYPYLAILPFQRQLFNLSQHFQAFRNLFKETFNYAKWIFFSALFYVLSLQLPVLLLKHFDKINELAVLGVAMTVASFSSWLSYSLRPFFIGKYLQGETGISPYLKLLGLFIVALVPASIAVYYLMNFAFADKYIGVGLVATIVFVYTSLVFILGLYNGQIHVAGRPDLEAYVNLGRALTVFLFMTTSSYSLAISMTIVGVVMIGFEILLMMINYKLVQQTP